MSDEFRRRDGLIVKATGGSTGIPLRIYGDKEDYRINNMVVARQRRWVGYTQGMRTLTLFGAFGDAKSVRRLRLKELLLNDRAINVMDSEALDYPAILSDLRRRPVEVLVAYFGVLKQLASLALADGKPLEGLRAIMACGEAVTEGGRELVQRGLGQAMVASTARGRSARLGRSVSAAPATITPRTRCWQKCWTSGGWRLSAET